MTSSIPDAFSTEELQRMLAEAQPEPEVTTNPDDQPEDYIFEIAKEALELASDKSAGPLVHKVMLHQIVTHMYDWHCKMADSLLDEGMPEQAMGWSRDAGKFQSIMNILSTISVDEDDFTCSVK